MTVLYSYTHFHC